MLVGCLMLVIFHKSATGIFKFNLFCRMSFAVQFDPFRHQLILSPIGIIFQYGRRIKIYLKIILSYNK